MSNKKTDWFENESFWAQYSPVLFDAQRWAEAPTVAEGVLRIVGAPLDGKKGSGPLILDAGCGPGRIAVELATRGARVTGVDLIRPFLNAAQESAQSEGVELDLEQADLRTFVRPEFFDVAVNLYTSFGYCDTMEEDFQILKNIAASVRLGGWFILEMTGREIAVRDFTEGEWFERGGFTVLTEFSVVGAWEGLRSRWMLIDENGSKIDHVFVQRLYSAIELKRLMILSGFSSVEIYGDFDFSPYNEKARTMVLVARK
ncbi:MAG TPA: class I SAM-dependent methyltransferase [Treponemataceae bacterium]|nr:class I SAM-dependent methyltransferase [Treponemataceae bacterium]